MCVVCCATESKAWEQVQASGDIPSPRAAFGMDVVGGSIYVFGGRDTTKRQNDLYVVRTRTAPRQTAVLG